MAILKMLIGLAGAGKSTYTEKFPNDVVVSSDAIRQEVFGDVNDQSHNGEVFNIFIKRAREALKAGSDVILDATNLRRKYRQGILEQMPKDCEKVAVVFATPFERCLEQNRQRERHVPEHVMWKMYKSFEPPHVAEGFDRIVIVDTDDEVPLRIEEIEELRKIPHNNPHHQLSIGDHCLKTCEEMELLLREEKTGMYSSYDEMILRYAALLHDVGKKETKVFTNMKGESTEIAHFYFHEHVGAYKALLLTKDKPTDFRIEVANIVSLHMTFYGGDKAIENRKKIFGESFWEKVSLVHKADMRGHLREKGIPV